MPHHALFGSSRTQSRVRRSLHALALLTAPGIPVRSSYAELRPSRTREHHSGRAAGYDAETTFRPPSCKRLLAVPLYLAGNDRTNVTWDLEPDSAKGITGDADAMTDYVVDGVRPGSVVLMHVMYDSREASREALPLIIEQLSDAGYRFVTVSELLTLRSH